MVVTPLSPEHSSDGAAPLSKRERAALALSELANVFVSRRLTPDDAYEELEAAARAWTSKLAGADMQQTNPEQLRGAFFPQSCMDGDPVTHFRHCFINGSVSPISMGLSAHRCGDEVRASVEFGPLYQGAPGRVHGGALAAVLDDVTGLVLNIHRLPALTASLSISYHRPVPIGTPVAVRAALADRTGRKLTIRAAATVDGDVAAECEALFVVVTKDHWIAGQ